MSAPYPTALTIAGSDSGGGAGIQADLKTFLDHGVFGMTVITAITAQNSTGVRRVDLVDPDAVTAQLEAVFDDFPVGAVKIGMLGTSAHIRAVAAFLGGLPVDARPPIVLDPVMVASTGHRLLAAEAEVALREALAPLAVVVTPNRDEAAVLAGVLAGDPAGDGDGDPDPAQVDAWARASATPVLITGGDTRGAEIVDRLFAPGGRARAWRHPRVGDRPFHGTGCTLAAAIAARLARAAARPGDLDALEAAIDGAIGYVGALVAAADRLGSVGRGNPSLPHGL